MYMYMYMCMYMYMYVYVYVCICPYFCPFYNFVIKSIFTKFIFIYLFT